MTSNRILGKDLNITGIIGKAGKSTIAHIIHHCLESATEIESAAGFLNNLPVDSYEKSGKNVIIEVSVCEIREKKVSYIDFDCLIFANSENVNPDEKWTMMRPFIALAFEKTAIINIDDEYGVDFCDVTIAKMITYSLKKPADLNARNIKLAINKTEFDLYFKGKLVCRIKTPYFGIYNIYNTLAAIAHLISINYDLAKAALLLQKSPLIAGRFDTFTTKSGVNVVVDYARSSDAIGAVLRSLATVCRGNIITVVGADANVSASERMAIGKNALTYSEQVIFTSDNPRTEEPLSIIYDILKGNVRQNFRICIDREKAIENALKMSRLKDVVIILGKGNETIQVIGEKARFFCDKKVAKYLAEKFEI